MPVIKPPLHVYLSFKKMKNSSLTYLLIFWSLIGASQSITSIQIFPSNPNNNDLVRAIVHTQMNTSSCWLSTSSISSSSYNHSIIGAHCSGLTQQVCNASDTFILGSLQPGGHTLTYTMYYNNLSSSQTNCSSYQFGDTLTINFSVSNSQGNLPVDIHPHGEHHICEGDSMLMNCDGEATDSFQWLFNGNPIPGATQQNHWASDSGFYQAKRYANGDSGLSQAVLVHRHSLPGGPLTQTGYIVETNKEAQQYQWHHLSTGIISGADSHQVDAVQSGGTGDYFVLMTDEWQCEGSSDTLYVELIDAFIYPGDTVVACLSDSTTLAATPADSVYTYQWLLDGQLLPDSMFLMMPMVSGEYQVIVSISQSLDTSDIVSFYVIPAPVPTLYFDGVWLSTDSFASYQWHLIGQGAVIGATSQHFEPVLSGTYYLQVTDSNGCKGVSNGIFAEVLGAEQIGKEVPQVWSDGHHIRVRGANNDHIALYDVRGALLSTAVVNSNDWKWDRTPEQSGVYIVRISSPKHSWNYKLLMR